MSRFISAVSNLIKPASSCSISTTNQPLSVLSWNIWFDRFAYHIRMDMIFKIIQRKMPDVICLQEVLPQFLPLLLQQEWCAQYVISDTGSGESVHPYGVLMLVKRHLNPTFSFSDFPSNMDRRLLTATISHGGEMMLVGTVHLESLNTHKTREKQLKICADILKTCKNAILCGDFNFCSYQNYSGGGALENDSLAKILPQYTDMWLSKNPDEKGYTFDSVTNNVIHQHERMRYDRVLYRLDSTALQASSITLEGTASAAQAGVLPTRADSPAKAPEPPVVDDPYATPPKRVPPLAIRVRHEVFDGFSQADLEQVFPSDHFGLLAIFTPPTADDDSTANTTETEKKDVTHP